MDKINKIDKLMQEGLSVLDMSETELFAEQDDFGTHKFDVIFFKNLFDHPDEKRVLELLDIMKKQLNVEGKILIQQQLYSIDENEVLGKSHILECVHLAEKKLVFEKMERQADDSNSSLLYCFSNLEENECDEKIRYFDEQFFLKGVDQKQVVHKNGDWHETIHAYFFCDGYLLVQKRAQNKHDFPDYFDMSIAGHIQYFESADDAFKRETKEELGIAFDVLLKEYRSLCYLKDEIISETIDREIAWIYVGEFRLRRDRTYYFV